MNNENKPVGTVLGGEFHYLTPNHGLADGTALYALAARQPDAPPAQAVDLGQFREAVQEAYENADAGTLNKFSLEELLALIDSQGGA